MDEQVSQDTSPPYVWERGDVKDSNEPYEAGMVQIATPRCGKAHDVCSALKHDHSFYHATESTVYLPHSCGEWIIGGRLQIEAMIDDLRSALETLEREGQQCRRI